MDKSSFATSTSHLAALAEESALGPVQRDEALFLFGIVRVIRPGVSVEFGFGRGVSAFNFLRALDGQGELYSYDISDGAAQAAGRLAEFGNFHFIRKSQESFSPDDIGNRLIDFVFLDGAHDLPLLQKTFSAILPSLAPNALLAVHDTGTWRRDFFLEPHWRFPKERQQDWLNTDEFQHRKSEREFVNWIERSFPAFQLIHLHSTNCLRHGISLLQRQRALPTDSETAIVQPGSPASLPCHP